jgi:hypothetical protein
MDEMKKLSEQIQSDLITYLDGFNNEIIDGVCQIITDRFDRTYERDLINDWAMTRMADAEMGDL